MRYLLALALTVLLFVAGAIPVEAQELGLQVELGLRPFYEAGTPRWDFSLGAYARASLTEQYAVRLTLGTAVSPYRPFLHVIVTRPMTPEWTLEGGLRIEVLPRRSLSATATVGTRLTIGHVPDPRFEFASFPFGWRLSSVDGRLLGAFLIDGNLLFDITVGTADPILIGEGIRFRLVRESLGSEPAVLSIGSGWALGLDLITHIGTRLSP